MYDKRALYNDSLLYDKNDGAIPSCAANKSTGKIPIQNAGPAFVYDKYNNTTQELKSEQNFEREPKHVFSQAHSPYRGPQKPIFEPIDNYEDLTREIREAQQLNGESFRVAYQRVIGKLSDATEVKRTAPRSEYYGALDEHPIFKNIKSKA
jgi:hypothetical protein